MKISDDSSGNSLDSKKYDVGEEYNITPLNIMINDNEPNTYVNSSSEHQARIIIKKSILSK